MPKNTSILLVDDVEYIRHKQYSLLKAKGVSYIYQAEDGLEGLECYKKYHPNLTVLDISMPGMNGIQALSEIFRYDRFAKVVMCSAVRDASVIQQCLRVGAKDYIVKPFSDDDYINTLSRHIRL